MYGGSVGTFGWLSLLRRKWWRGIYSLHTKSNRYTLLTQLGSTETDISVAPNCVKDMNIRNLGGTDIHNSDGPKCNGLGQTSSRWHRLHQLGWTEVKQ